MQPYAQIDTAERTQSAAVRFLDDWVSLREGARVPRCSVATMRRAIKRGQLRYARIGTGKGTNKKGQPTGHLRTRISWIHEWLEASKTPVEINR